MTKKLLHLRSRDRILFTKNLPVGWTKITGVVQAKINLQEVEQEEIGTNKNSKEVAKEKIKDSSMRLVSDTMTSLRKKRLKN